MYEGNQIDCIFFHCLYLYWPRTWNVIYIYIYMQCFYSKCLTSLIIICKTCTAFYYWRTKFSCRSQSFECLFVFVKNYSFIDVCAFQYPNTFPFLQSQKVWLLDNIIIGSLSDIWQISINHENDRYPGDQCIKVLTVTIFFFII